MSKTKDARGILDTSVLIDLSLSDSDELPEEIAITTLSLAELACGPHATDNRAERARRQERLQSIEATFAALPFDAESARAYGRIFAAVSAAGRKARGRRSVDLMIAATALASGLPLYTRNPADFDGLGDLVRIVPVRRE